MKTFEQLLDDWIMNDDNYYKDRHSNDYEIDLNDRYLDYETSDKY